MSLGRKIARGGFWLQGSRLIQLLSNIVVTAILARLLTPGIFGLAGIVTLVVSVVSMATGFGITVGIVQRQNIDQDQLSSAYWINTGFSLFSAVLLVASSPWIARFYEEPQLVPLIILLSTNFLIVPLFQINRRLLEKELRFSTIAVVEMISAVGSGIVGIAMALMGFGVYSLIWQILALNILYAVSYNVARRWRPSLTFSFSRVRDLTVFSLKIKGARMMGFASRNIDFLLLSKLFTPALYGMYSVGYRFVSFPLRRFGFLFSETLFPAFSKIQSDHERIRNGVLRSFYLLLLVLLPLLVLLHEFGREVVILVLGEQWMPLAGLLYLFAAVGACMTLECVSAAVYPAINRPGILIRFNALRTIATAVAALIGYTSGLGGVAIALVVVRLVIFLVDFGLLSRILSIPAKAYIATCHGPIVACLVMLVVLVLMPARASEGNDVLASLVTMMVAVFSYVAAIGLLDRKEIIYYVKLLAR